MRYRDLADIQQNSAPTSAMGPDYSGPPFMEGVPGLATCTTGRATHRGEQLIEEVDYVWEQNYIEGITPDMRLLIREGVHAGKELSIKAVIPKIDGSRKPETWLMCSEIVA